MQIAQSLEILPTTTHPNHPCIACSAFSLILIKKCHARGKWACLCCNVLVRREMHSSAIKAELKSITFYGEKIGLHMCALKIFSHQTDYDTRTR